MALNDERNSSEVFRFVTVRNPQILSSGQAKTGFLYYNGNISNQKTSTLFNNLVEAKQKESNFEDIKPEIDNYKRSNEFLVSKKLIDSQFPNWLNFYNWLNQCRSHLTIEKVQEVLNKTFGEELPSELARAKNDEINLTLWDNLFIQLIEPEEVVVREWIIQLLRMVNLLVLIDQKADELNSTDHLQRLIKARPVLPKSIAPFPKPQSNDQDELIQEKAPVDYTNLLKENETIDEIIENLRLIVAEKKERALIQQQQLPEPNLAETDTNNNDIALNEPLISVRNFSIKEIEGLDKNTQSWLKKVGVPASGFRVDFAIKLLKKYKERNSSIIRKQVQSSERIVVIGNTSWQVNKVNEVVSQVLSKSGSSGNSCKVTPLGIADLRIVKQDLLCYKPGEIAHVENVMSGEFKERTTRSLTRTEETYTFESEQINETEKDVQTTERYELEKESSSVIQSDTHFDIGVNIAGNLGPMQISTTTGFATNNAQTESNFVASQYAREITSRARSRIIKRVREQRSITTIREFEETNLHRLENTADKNMVGLYRWLNKTYLARIENYGKRLMFEFIVPEPAAFHLHAMSESQVANAGHLEKPRHPKVDGIKLTPSSTIYLHSAEDVSESNYLDWAAAYDVQQISPPPAGNKTLSYAIKQDPSPEDSENVGLNYRTIVEKDLTLQPEEGYIAEEAIIRVNWQRGTSGAIMVQVGQAGAWFGPTTTPPNPWNTNPRTIQLDGEDGVIPITCYSYDVRYMVVNIEIICIPSERSILEWKIATYSAIMEAYQNKLGEYNNGLAELQVGAGISIRGNNPLRNREIEKDELKRRCIEIYSGQSFYGSWSMQHDKPPYGYPELHVCSTILDTAPRVKFFEQVFEWDLMTYTFYPYFWARKSRWTELYPLEDTDTVFSAFLRSGSAKVVIPVRPNFEEAALYYLENGTFPPAGELPSSDDQTHQSILTELDTPTPEMEDGKWQIKLPTNLVALQCESGCIEEKGLPCYEDELLGEEGEHDCENSPVIGG